MRLLVVGSAGSIGKRRKGILEDMGHTVVGVDPKEHTYFSPELAKQFDATLICTPPSIAPSIASDCATANVPFFLEKPGAISHRELLDVVAKTQKTDLVTMVACNIRFTPEYKAIQEALPNLGTPLFAYAEFGYFLPWWREGQYRTYYSCYRMAGGGVLMDAIHELDYMFSLFGFPEKAKLVAGTFYNSKELEDLDAEDTANLYIVYSSNLNMYIHLDYLQRAYKRTFSAVGTKGRIDQTFNVQGSNSMYRSEMTHFLDCVKKGQQPIKTVEQHLKLLEFIDKVREAAK